MQLIVRVKSQWQRSSFSNDTGSVSISWSFDGDYYVSIEANAHGYSGHSDAHVVRGAFEAFRSAMSNLRRKRKGSASFESIHPGLFDLTVESIDRRGHLAVRGMLSYDPLNDESRAQQYNFFLEFDPSQIEVADMVLQSDAT